MKDESTVPVGISNRDLEAENLEPQNAQKLSIDVAPQKEKLNLYVFRPAKVEDGEKTPIVYFIHGGGYHVGNTAMLESKIQDVADGSNATVVSPDYTLSLDPSYKYPVELEEAYAGLLYVYQHADELNVDKDNIVIEGESAGGEDDIYKNEYAGEFVWSKENNVFGWGKLIEGHEKKLADEEMIYFSPATATVEHLKGLPETFMIVGSLDLFCNEDMDYAKKLIQAGVFTELYVEPGVPHAYEYWEGTPQTERFYELRDRATARMLGSEYHPKASGEITGFGDFLKYLFGK